MKLESEIESTHLSQSNISKNICYTFNSIYLEVLSLQKKTVSINGARIAKTIGADIETARLKRRLPRSVVANRAGISLLTLSKIIKGDPGVSFGRYAAVLAALGARTRLEKVIAPEADMVGLKLDEENLPKRIRPANSGDNNG